MKVVIDTCALYPTVMRKMLLEVANRAIFIPLWSDRILEEWALAYRKTGPLGEMQARSEIALLKARWPDSAVTSSPILASRLWLPDPDDIHVLAAAITSSADLIITLNTSDFPRNILSEEDLTLSDPDSFLCGLYQTHPAQVTAATEQVLAETRQATGTDWTQPKLLKKASLSRLAKNFKS
ncbi:MAG: PIN domain-containing protein [Paracoccaceae bacterium]|nr:PIN domain-containing protein [Paracoccaceae bacterium]